jgi:hypothetical protein
VARAATAAKRILMIVLLGTPQPVCRRNPRLTPDNGASLTRTLITQNLMSAAEHGTPALWDHYRIQLDSDAV